MSVRDSLRESLPRDSEFRHAYAEEILNLMVCTQARVLREQREMTQEDLARKIGTSQAAICRLENVNYSAWTVGTLKKLARAFDVRLRITFEGFGTLWRDVGSMNREDLQKPPVEADPEFAAPNPERLVVGYPDVEDSLSGRLLGGSQRVVPIEEGRRLMAQKKPQRGVEPPEIYGGIGKGVSNG